MCSFLLSVIVLDASPTLCALFLSEFMVCQVKCSVTNTLESMQSWISTLASSAAV